MGVQSRPFGEFRSSEGYVLSADAFDLTNSRGVTATLTNWGATLTGLRLPGRDAEVKLAMHRDSKAAPSARLGQQVDDVVLGFDDLAGYMVRPVTRSSVILHVLHCSTPRKSRLSIDVPHCAFFGQSLLWMHCRPCCESHLQGRFHARWQAVHTRR